MCGIAGAFGQADGAELTRTMTGTLAHRGPDATGSWQVERDRLRIHLGHRRLTIIDLSAAAGQPLVKDGLVLVYNGELYNYRELRAELAGRGARFVTSSDTEVVLEAWRAWGPAALTRFRGMFAFALADPDRGELILARDPLGIKPLYLMPRAGGLLFASELKALVAAAGPELSVDPAGMVASMLYYWVPDQRCALSGAAKLPPGCWARIRAGQAEPEIRPYWRISEVAAEAAEGEPAGPDQLAEVIAGSVRAHLVADVPVASFLSGGLDSSIITVLAGQQKIQDQVDAYTITFRQADQRLEAMPDDARYARMVADRYGVKLHEIELAPDVAALLPTMAATLDEPIGDPAAINTWLMCQAARDRGIKVVLSGMGADELFGGYRRHLACLVAGRYARLPWPARALTRAAVAALPVSAGGRGLRYPRWAKRFLSFAELDEEPRYRRSYTLYDPGQLAGLAGEALLPALDEVLAEHRRVFEDTTLTDPVNRMCLADTRLFLPGLNLAYTDRAAMAASVEVRVPFVDPEVTRAAFAVAGRDKIRWLNRRPHGKAALKRAAETWLPPEIIYRPKASFGAPLRSWVRNELREPVRDLLAGGELVQAGLLRAGPLTEMIARDQAGREDLAKQIWQLLTLELWYRNMRSHGVRCCR